MSLNKQNRIDHATRSLVAPNLLVLLGRAQGLDILRWDEQSSFVVKTVDINSAGEVSDEFASGAELVGFHKDAGTAEFKKLDHINYPVPGYTGYDLS